MNLLMRARRHYSTVAQARTAADELGALGVCSSTPSSQKRHESDAVQAADAQPKRLRFTNAEPLAEFPVELGYRRLLVPATASPPLASS